MKRKIIKIDEDKCNGCGECVPNCREGALKIIDGKARLVSDIFCDGLGACLGHCPQGAITIEERDAAAFDEKKAHLHVHAMGGCPTSPRLRRTIRRSPPSEDEGGCPGSQMMDFRKEPASGIKAVPASRQESQLRQWPVQLKLAPSSAPYFQDTDLVICADCVPFAYANFHEDFLKDKALVIACPKLDDVDFYRQKLAQIFKDGKIRAIKIMHMEVPCCFGLNALVEDALKLSQKKLPVEEVVISITGEIKSPQ